MWIQSETRPVDDGIKPQSLIIVIEIISKKTYNFYNFDSYETIYFELVMFPDMMHIKGYLIKVNNVHELGISLTAHLVFIVMVQLSVSMG